MKKGFLSSKPKKKISNKTKQKQSSTNIVENAIQSITTKNKQQKQGWLFLLQRTDDIIEAKELIHMCAEAGANAAKFQNFFADTIVSDFGFKQIAYDWSKTMTARAVMLV